MRTVQVDIRGFAITHLITKLSSKFFKFSNNRKSSKNHVYSIKMALLAILEGVNCLGVFCASTCCSIWVLFELLIRKTELVS